MENESKNESINKIDKYTNWEKLLDIIKNNKFNEKYPNYYLLIKENRGYLLSERNNKDNKIFLFKEKKSLKIYIKDQVKTIEIFSSLQIEDFIQSNNYAIHDLFIKNTQFQYISKINNLGIYLANNELEIIPKKKLPNLIIKDLLKLNEDYKPEEYSKYFYKYFIYEDKEEKDKKIIYEKNAIRDLIQENMINLRENEDLRKYKLTGPTSIGKSFTLFRISRVLYNFVYINLKVLNNLKKDIYLCYSIIISELERIGVVIGKDSLNKLNKIIQDNYDKNIYYLDLLLKIMEFLNTIKYITFVFIFDQFKNKYIDDGFMEKIKGFENIKYVSCSSINDKNLREECLKTWTIKGKNILKLTADIQDFYIYYSTLYNYNNNKDTNNILRKVGNLPKYKLMYEEINDAENLLKKIKDNVILKINEFCEINKINKNDLLIHLKFIINKEYNHSDLENIIKYCPLKYFFIYFTKYMFKVMPMFPYMLNIIKAELSEEECYNYFKNEEYKYNTIEGESIKGYYFEESVKFGIQKICKYKKIFTLNEIVSMEKIIYKDDEFIEEEEYSEIYKEIQKILENKAIQEVINNNDNDEKNNDKDNKSIAKGNETNKKCKEKEVVEENDENGNEEIEDDENEFLEEEEEKDEIEDNNLREKEQEENGEENEKFNEVLKKFDIQENRNIINNKNYLTKNAILLSRTIEDYRQEEIKEQKRKEQKIKNYRFNGDDPFLLDQINKKGKTLDYAYLSGTSNNKTFFGFKMKCYFENSILNNNAIDKTIIKEKCKKILVNSMKLFNCKINNWNYILIFYYNSRNKKDNINIDNLKKCQSNGIEYIFYDPVAKVFYNSSHRKIINKLKITKSSNLDCTTIDAKNDSINIDKLYLRKGKIEVGMNIKLMIESFINDLSNICQEKNKPQIHEILEKIKENIGLSGNLYFNCRYPIIIENINTPNNYNVYLYKQKDNKYYIALIRVKNELKFFDLSKKKKELNSFYNIFDEHSKYYYSLGIIKKRKLKNSPIKIDFSNDKEKI